MYFVVKGQVRIVKAIIDKDVRQVEPVFLELCINGPLSYFGESILIFIYIYIYSGISNR